MRAYRGEVEVRPAEGEASLSLGESPSVSLTRARESIAGDMSLATGDRRGR